MDMRPMCPGGLTGGDTVGSGMFGLRGKSY